MRRIALALCTVLSFSQAVQAGEKGPPCEVPLAGFALEINLETSAARLCEDGRIVARYPIATPRHTAYLIRSGILPLYGEVKEIRYNPTWYPTPNIRAESGWNEEKGDWNLGTIVAPYRTTRGNPLGVGFLVIEYPDGRNPRLLVDGFHGNNKVRPVLAGARASHGCIRSCNNHWMLVAERVSAEFRAGRTVNVVFVAVADSADDVVRTMFCFDPSPLPLSRTILRPDMKRQTAHRP